MRVWAWDPDAARDLEKVAFQLRTCVFGESIFFIFYTKTILSVLIFYLNLYNQFRRTQNSIQI